METIGNENNNRAVKKVNSAKLKITPYSLETTNVAEIVAAP